MKDTKKWWQSKGMIGGLAAVIAGIAGFWNVDFDVQNIEELITSGVAFAAGIIAMIGRFKAVKKIG
jgi:phage shock protein PspC (stress-responsive transcriptional regulator)